MKCPKCGCKEFILESVVVVTETYRIYKNGRVSDHPIDKDFCNGDMGDYDNIIRCKGCETGYVLIDKSRNELINDKVDFSKIDLERETIEIEY